jgi:hypothetical protein
MDNHKEVYGPPHRPPVGDVEEQPLTLHKEGQEAVEKAFDGYIDDIHPAAMTYTDVPPFDLPDGIAGMKYNQYSGRTFSLSEYAILKIKILYLLKDLSIAPMLIRIKMTIIRIFMKKFLTLWVMPS